MGRIKRILGILFILVVFLGQWTMADAGEGVGISPDEKAILTDYLVTDTEFYPKGYKVLVTEAKKPKETKEGEHYYTYAREGDINLAYWVVEHPYGKCVHDHYPEEDTSGNTYHGVPFRRQICGKSYYSGWCGYCADCGNKAVDFMIYMDQETAKKFASFHTSKYYCYVCPNCNNLEQGRKFNSHLCKGISANRYFVKYNANGGNGYVSNSVHYYNNASTYEGREVTPRDRLMGNRYIRKGYEFVGWNTRPDGSGIGYADKDKIYNLTSVQNGTITLYAQWKPCESSLLLVTGKGTYQGRTNPEFTGNIENPMTINKEEITPPKAATIHFDVNGGERLSDAFCTWSYAGLEKGVYFSGKLEGMRYWFSGEKEKKDVIEVLYDLEEIVLPTPKREGYSFGGWFFDKAATKVAGFPGDTFSSNEEITLYAYWADLGLKAKDNYIAFQGSGASDLSWVQKDGVSKIYQVFQKKEGEEFIQIFTNSDPASKQSISREFTCDGKQQKFQIPENGFYTLQLAGAAGQDINLNMGKEHRSQKGGKAGVVEGTFYLQKDDELTIVLGEEISSKGKEEIPGEGGKGIYFGNGGGYSMVSSGEKGILMIAGGGGGAGFYEDGGNGGKLAVKVGSQGGESNASGGGGGAVGGTGGSARIHFHDKACSHVHEGNPKTGGGCYTKVKECGNTDFDKKKIKEIFYYGNIDNQGNPVFCVRCGSYQCPGHCDVVYSYECKNCHREYESQPQVCKSIVCFQPNCGMEEGIICGLEEETVLWSVPGMGGSSYVNQELAITYETKPGENEGRGYLKLEGKYFDFTKDCTLKNVKATDEGKPMEIKEHSLFPLDNQRVRLMFTRPKDRGTIYEHQVKSYDMTSGKLLCCSNITRQDILTGVCGYRYRMDNLKDGTITMTDSYIASTGEMESLQFQGGEGKGMLHIAAQDRAGNLGKTYHISLVDITNKDWGVYTEDLSIKEGDNVYPSQETNTYYVRADGSTPFYLCVAAYTTGDMDSEKRLEGIALECFADTLRGKISFTFEGKQEGMYLGGDMEVCFEEVSYLGNASYTRAELKDMGKYGSVKQGFYFSEAGENERILLVPRAWAGENKESCEKQDRNNAILLIGDSQGPTILGFEEIENLKKGEQTQSQLITLQAYDTGSGLADFYVTVHNRDNDLEQRFCPDGEGSIHLRIEEEDRLFQGSYGIMVYATDHVGNQTVLSNEGLGVGINAYLKKLLPPDNFEFCSGESGKITVVSTGYVERIQVIFPEEFTARETGMNRDMGISSPSAYREDVLEFMVPLGVPDGEYEIQVIGYKEGSMLHQRPQRLWLTVKGSVVDRIHTRLR